MLQYFILEHHSWSQEATSTSFPDEHKPVTEVDNMAGINKNSTMVAHTQSIAKENGVLFRIIAGDLCTPTVIEAGRSCSDADRQLAPVTGDSQKHSPQKITPRKTVTIC